MLPNSTDKTHRKICLLHGLGGIGKTQLAVELARNCQGKFPAIFWIDGSTKEKLRRSIADLTSRLPQHQMSYRARSYSKETGEDLDAIVEDVLKWFPQPSNDQWLIIFDNVDREFSAQTKDPEAFDIKEYFPIADQGSVLITSRLASMWHLSGNDVKLEPVNELQGESILNYSVGRPLEGKWNENCTRQEII